MNGRIFLTFLEEQSLYHQVRAPADCCQDPAEGGNEGQGHEQSLGAERSCSRPVLRHRDQKRHHGCVVQESRHAQGQHRQPQKTHSEARLKTKNAAGHPVGNFRVLYRFHHHEEGANHERPWVVEARQGFCVGEEPGVPNCEERQKHLQA